MSNNCSCDELNFCDLKLISPKKTLIITKGNNGIFKLDVNFQEVNQFLIQDSQSINLSGNGQPGTPLTASIILDPNPSNLISITANGLFVNGALVNQGLQGVITTDPVLTADNDIDLNGTIYSMTHNGDEFFGVNSGAVSQFARIRAIYNNGGTINQSFFTGASNSTSTTATFSANFNASKIAVITGIANTTSATFSYSADTHHFTGKVGIGVLPTSSLQILKTAIGVTQSDDYGILLQNTTAAAAGAQQKSPPIVLEGYGWKTNAVAASQQVKWRIDVLPVEGAAGPSSVLQMAASINGGAYANKLTITSAGELNATTASFGTTTSIIVNVTDINNLSGSDLTIRTATIPAPQSILIIGGNSNLGNNPGGSISLTSGDGNGTGDGGNVNITAGSGNIDGQIIFTQLTNEYQFFGGASFYNILNFGISTTNRTYVLPDLTGDLALSSQGMDVASATNLVLGADGNVFEITGTNQIDLISNINRRNGYTVTLVFTSTPTVKDNIGTSGSNINIRLAGATDFVASANDTLTLLLCEVGGVQEWREVSRSVN